MSLCEVSGFDTETIGGYAVVLSTEHRSWEAHTFEECVRPLFNDIKSKKISNKCVMWNQGYDAQAILKYLPNDNVNELLDTTETNYDDKYKIRYVKGKFLYIKDISQHIVFNGYDIAQFFNYATLDDTAGLYLKQKKINTETTQQITTGSHGKSDDWLSQYFSNHIDEIKLYCRQDAYLTQQLGLYLSDTIFALFGFRIKNYTSKTMIGKELIKRQCGTYKTKTGKYRTAYPMFKEESMPGQFAKFSYHGGIFDCKMRGAFGAVTDVDISSAYPAWMRKLPNWNNGDFILVEPDEIEESDIYGWFQAGFDYPLVPYVSNEINDWIEYHEEEEIPVVAKNTKKFYPSGRRYQFITLEEVRFLKKNGYIFLMGAGYVWRHNPKKKQYPNPFEWITTVYEAKQQIKVLEGKESYKYSLTKIPMNSAYGSTAQNVGAKTYRNMFYASYITAQTRVQICELLENEIGYDNYISIATDGILINGNITLPDKYTKKKLGSWDVEHWDKALVLANGIYRLEKDYPYLKGNYKQALRGMLSFKGNLLDILQKHRHKSFFTPATKNRPITMHQAMRWNRYIKDDMNRFIETGRKMRCDTDKSKKWPEISCFDDLLNNQYIGTRYTVDEIDEL